MYNLINLLGGNIKTEKDRSYIIFGCLITSLMILSLSIYRFFENDILMAKVNLIIAAVLLIFSLYAWKSQNANCISVIVVLFSVSALLFTLHVKGANSLYWTFPLMTAVYYLLKKNHALVVTAITIILTYPVVKDSIIESHLIEIYPALILASIFQYCWANNSNYQKQRLAELASEDGLTKLQNRRSLNLKMREVLLETKRTNIPVSLLIFDIDHFKKINDKYGHNEGDNILKLFASLIKSSIRDTDHMFRFGGEEFVVITHNSNLKDASFLADYLRKKVESHSCCQKFQLTVSIGVTEIDAKYDDKKSWLKRADDALYAAKDAGRNRVFTATKSKRNKLRDSHVEFVQYDEEKHVRAHDKEHTLGDNIVPLTYRVSN